MSTASQPGQAATTEYPRILRHCRRCERETPHEIRTADGMSITVCVRCVERALWYELDRD
jgi:NMD protein affecting ribosome stability and mRNA decay